MNAPLFLCEHCDVASSPETVRWGRLPSAAASPIAWVHSGGTATIDTVSHEGILEDQGRDPVAFFGRFGIPAATVLADARLIAASDILRDPVCDGPHVVTGPIAVAGAKPGDLLRVETLALQRRTDYGIVSNRHGRGVLAGELPRPDPLGIEVPVVATLGRVVSNDSAELSDGSGRIRFPLREFLGLVGVAPATDIDPPSTPPGPHGGNLDIRHLGVGTSLYLPVQVDGALLYVADPHFAQGNGEVALTALEAPLRATLRLTVLNGPRERALAAALNRPYGQTDDFYIAVGIGTTLDEAMRDAVRHSLTLVRDTTGLGESISLAYLSAAADFEVSQAVNGVRGVHCLIRKTDLDNASRT